MTGHHLTADGWKIDGRFTPRRIAEEQMRLRSLDEAGLAAWECVPLAEIVRRLADDDLQKRPIVPPEVNATLAKPLPAIDVPQAGRGTDADIIRLCGIAISALADFQTVDAVTGGTLYEPPVTFAAGRDALGAAAWSAQRAAAAIQATTPAGLKAKAGMLFVFMDLDCDSLDGQPLVTSILEDCAALAASR